MPGKIPKNDKTWEKQLKTINENNAQLDREELAMMRFRRKLGEDSKD